VELASWSNIVLSQMFIYISGAARPLYTLSNACYSEGYLRKTDEKEKRHVKHLTQFVRSHPGRSRRAFDKEPQPSCKAHSTVKFTQGNKRDMLECRQKKKKKDLKDMANHLGCIGERLRVGRPSLTPPNSAHAASTSSLADMHEPLLLIREGVLLLL
jgi:hypothetical protein